MEVEMRDMELVLRGRREEVRRGGGAWSRGQLRRVEALDRIWAYSFRAIRACGLEERTPCRRVRALSSCRAWEGVGACKVVLR